MKGVGCQRQVISGWAGWEQSQEDLIAQVPQRDGVVLWMKEAKEGIYI